MHHRCYPTPVGWNITNLKLLCYHRTHHLLRLNGDLFNLQSHQSLHSFRTTMQLHSLHMTSYKYYLRFNTDINITPCLVVKRSPRSTKRHKHKLPAMVCRLFQNYDCQILLEPSQKINLVFVTTLKKST